MKRKLAVLVLSFLVLSSAAWATPDGIWRDNPMMPTYNFYIQTYTTGSMLVIVASGADRFWAFLDSNYADGFSVSQDLAGHSHSLSIAFTNDDNATATLTFQGQSAQTFTITRAFAAPSSSSSGGGNPPSGTLTSPSNGATVSGTVTIQGTATDDVGVQRVGIRIGSASEVNASFNSSTGQFSYSWDTTSSANGTVTIAVTVYDTEGLSTAIALISVTVNNASSGNQVTLVSPANGSTNTPPFDLVWNAVPGAVSYQIQVADDAAFTSIETDRTWTSTSFTVTAGSGGPFYWRVRANFSGSTGPWSDVWTFFLPGGGSGPAPGPAPAPGTKVTLVSPVNGANVTLPVPLVWNPLSGAVSYRVQICMDAACSLVLMDQNWPWASMSLNGAGITAGSTYYWRVQANFSGSTSDWSDSWAFTIVAGPSDRNLKEGFSPVAGGEILTKVANLPITSWYYKDRTPRLRHVGPMAQDFHAAFGVGDDRHIYPMDEGGVALAAIQELYRMVSEQQKRIEELEKQNKALTSRLETAGGK